MFIFLFEKSWPVAKLSSLTFLMILTLRICDTALIKYYKVNFNSDGPY